MSEAHTVFDAEKYVRENSYPLHLEDHSTIGLKLRCIDDLSSHSTDKRYDIAIPGSGLGIVMDLLGGLALLRRKGKHVSLEPRKAIDIVEKALGAITFHTDEKSVKNRGIECGGCGHCNAALIDPQRYLLSESEAKYFLESGLADVKGRLKLRGVKPTVYSGLHNARAVITVMGEDIGLPSVGKSGECVYVYHKSFHELFLTLVAHELERSFHSHSQGVSDEELVDALHESARTRLSVTLEKLANDLPKFVVGDKQNISVQAV